MTESASTQKRSTRLRVNGLAMPDLDRRARWTRAITSWTVTLVGLLVLTYVLGVLRAPDLPNEAPAFTSRTTQGEPFALTSLRGRPVVLNFWAIWCGPCRFETPAISRFAARHPEVAVIGVVAPESPERLRAAISELEISYPVVRGTASIFDAYGVDTFPTTVFIDEAGQVVSAHIGLMLDPQFEVAALSF